MYQVKIIAYPATWYVSDTWIAIKKQEVIQQAASNRLIKVDGLIVQGPEWDDFKTANNQIVALIGRMREVKAIAWSRSPKQAFRMALDEWQRKMPHVRCADGRTRQITTHNRPYVTIVHNGKTVYNGH